MRKAMPAQLQLSSANGRTADEYDEVAPFDAKNARRAQSLPKDGVPRRNKMRSIGSNPRVQ
jgi:hypothetical protein